MKFASPTKTWRNASYPAISPSNNSLSVTGKSVFITRGAAGIGLAIACAFAAAGASTIAISGRTDKTLLSAKNGIESAHEGVTVLPFVADVTDQKAVHAAFASVGNVDILVHKAGYLTHLVPISQSRLQDWWSGFETNAQGSFIVTQAFLRVAASDATLVDLTTGMVHLPALPLYSAYQASEIAELGLFDSVQLEYPEMHVVHVHPGVVATDVYQKTFDAGVEFPLDDGNIMRLGDNHIHKYRLML